MICEDLFYDGKWLSSYEMKMYDPDSDPEFATREIERSEFTSVRNRPNHFSTHYSDSLKLEFLIIRDSDLFDNQSDLELSGDDIHELRSWLESAKTPKELILPKPVDDETTHFFGIFTSVQPFALDGICYGLKLVFSCDSPYGFSDLISTDYSVNGSASAITKEIYNGSAELYEYMMPTITINSSTAFGSSESVQITNTTDDGNIMEIDMPSGKTKLIIDCSKKIITDGSGNLVPLADLGVSTPSSSNYSFISADRYMFYWLRLAPEFNQVSVKGSSGNTIKNVDISYRYALKSGGF